MKEELFPYTGREVKTRKFVLVWRCSECGFFTKTYEPVNPKSLFPFPWKRIPSKSWLTNDWEIEIKKIQKILGNREAKPTTKS